MFGLAIPINTIRVSTLLFYVDILGLDVRAFGTVMAVYAVIDAVDNPVLGHLSDRTRSRWGRRRPWLVVGAVVLTAGLAWLQGLLCVLVPAAPADRRRCPRRSSP